MLAVTTPKIRGTTSTCMPTFITLYPEMSAAPKITGILIKNAKLALSSLESFANVPLEITVPLLDRPGTIAIDCATPIMIELLYDNGKVFLLRFAIFSAKNSSVAVSKKVIANKIAERRLPW